MVDLRQVLDEETQKIERRISQAAQERDESATPTESTHDQTRQVANQLFNSLLEEKAKLYKLGFAVKKFNKITDIEKENREVLRIMIVPDGLGGKNVDGVLLVGESSPLGQKVKGLKECETYEMNGDKFRIVRITKVGP